LLEEISRSAQVCGSHPLGRASLSGAVTNGSDRKRVGFDARYMEGLDSLDLAAAKAFLDAKNRKQRQSDWRCTAASQN
jgi:hypothetical protein